MTARPEGIAPPKGPKYDELIERLRQKRVTKWLDFGAEMHFVNPDGPAAASRIAELKAERERLIVAAYDKGYQRALSHVEKGAWGNAHRNDDIIALSNPPSGEVS